MITMHLMDHTAISRRRLLKTSAAALLASSVWPGQLSADDAATKDFTFIEVNDLHYTTEACSPHFERLVKTINDMKDPVDLVLVVGDLSENGTGEQLNPMRDILKKLKCPFYPVIGNHDHDTASTCKFYAEAFPDGFNYTFDHNGYQFIGLDTSDGQKFENVAASKATLDWLNQTLTKLDKNRPTVLFTHFPLGPLTPMRVTNADDLLAPLRDFNLQAIFNGHFHGYTARDVQNCIATTDRCCSFKRNNHDQTKEKGFFLCSAKGGKVTREFVEFKFPAA